MGGKRTYHMCSGHVDSKGCVWPPSVRRSSVVLFKVDWLSKD